MASPRKTYTSYQQLKFSETADEIKQSSGIQWVYCLMIDCIDYEGILFTCIWHSYI